MNRAQRRYGAGRNHDKTKKYHTYYSRDYINIPSQRKMKPKLCMRNRCCAVSSKDLEIFKKDIKLTTKIFKPSSPESSSPTTNAENNDKTKAKTSGKNKIYVKKFPTCTKKAKDNVSSSSSPHSPSSLPSPPLPIHKTKVSEQSSPLSACNSYNYYDASSPVRDLLSSKSRKSVYSQTATDLYNTLLREQFGLKQKSSDKLNEVEYILKEKKYVQISQSTKTEGTNTVINNNSNTEGDKEDFGVYEVDNVDDVDSFINKLTPPKPCLSQKTVHISKSPRIKTIAEKYYKYKKNGYELRKLLERVTCLEYDIVDRETLKTVQVMRLYFLMKPVYKTSELTEEEHKPSEAFIQMLKQECNVPDEELVNANFKQIEVIDDHVSLNKTYLDDLKKVLHRNGRLSRKKTKTSLNLEELYQAAKKDKPILDSMVSQTFISRAEMKEVKELITTCMTEGINTRNIKHSDDKSLDKLVVGLMSKSIVHELFTESGISETKLKP